MSPALIHEADRVIDLDHDFLSPFFAARGPVVPLGTQPAELESTDSEGGGLIQRR